MHSQAYHALAQAIVEEIIYDMCDRVGFDAVFESLDTEVHDELVADLERLVEQRLEAEIDHT